MSTHNEINTSSTLVRPQELLRRPTCLVAAHRQPARGNDDGGIILVKRLQLDHFPNGLDVKAAIVLVIQERNLHVAQLRNYFFGPLHVPFGGQRQRTEAVEALEKHLNGSAEHQVLTSRGQVIEAGSEICHFLCHINSLAHARSYLRYWTIGHRTAGIQTHRGHKEEGGKDDDDDA